MNDGHACPSCTHDIHSVEALRDRLADLDGRGDDDEASFQAWTEYFEEVCGLVADVTCLDVDAVMTILEGLMVLDGAGRAKGAAVGEERPPSPQPRVGRCNHAPSEGRRRRKAVIVVAGSG